MPSLLDLRQETDLENIAHYIAERWGFPYGVSAADVGFPTAWSVRLRIAFQRLRIAWFKRNRLPKITNERLRQLCDEWADYAEWQCQEAEAASNPKSYKSYHGFSQWRRNKP